MADTTGQNIKQIVVTALITCFFTIIAGVVVYFLTLKPKPRLEVYYALTDTKPSRKDAIGGLNLKYEQDKKINRFEVSVWSSGDDSDGVKEVEIDIRSMREKVFLLPDIVYDPPMIERYVLKKTFTGENVNLQLRELPGGTGVFLLMNSDDYFEKKEVNIAVIGNGRKWPAIEKQVILKAPKSTFWKDLFCEVQLPASEAYALDKPNVTPAQKKTPKSGVYFGGYNPVILTNQIFVILQDKRIIDKREAERIKKATEEIKSGVGIGSVDVLKFNEEVLNTLIQKKVINLFEAESMLERSRNAGGVLINGYNIIHLNAEILNALSKRNFISLREAQAALDNSKAPKSD
jgi:hypothetical protein